MNDPKLSVCIDVCNYESYLGEAIESVLGQRFEDYELIIADDCSKDRSFEIACDFSKKDSRVVPFKNPRNMGMVANRNVALKLARGEYVKILHADDFLFSKSALGKMTAYLDANPGASLVGSFMNLVDHQSDLCGQWGYLKSGRPPAGTTLISKCLWERKNLIGSPSAVMFRRDRGQRGFDESLFHSADWEMWLHLLEQGFYGHIDEPLVAYRIHQNQQTEKDKKTLTQYEDMLTILARYLPRPYVRLSEFQKAALLHRARRDYIRHAGLLNQPTEKLSGPSAKIPGPVFWLHRKWVRFASKYLSTSLHMGHSTAPATHSPGLNVAGFFQGEYGIGDSSRDYCRAIRETGLPTTFLNIPSRDHRNHDRTLTGFSKSNPHSVNVMTFSFDYARRFFRDRGKRFFKDRYNIAVWYWELESFPSRWHEAFDYYDEIWVATHFCERAFLKVSPIPITKIGYPFFNDPVAPVDRSIFGFEPREFLFLFNFDFHSVAARKNPEGLIAAFREAFGTNASGPRLVLKTINSHKYPALIAALSDLTRDLKVSWLHEHMDGSRMKQLFATADCYVSLHRSEGLGLGMARAMSYGKPVIATGYSGNMDFMTAENSFPVKYQITELERDHGVYEKGSPWAEPDISHAAELMQHVWKNPDEAARIGTLGKQDLQKTLCPASVQKSICERLSVIDPRINAVREFVHPQNRMSS
jgi:glycosyltransferase involved in cell wall biosynthesis